MKSERARDETVRWPSIMQLILQRLNRLLGHPVMIGNIIEELGTIGEAPAGLPCLGQSGDVAFKPWQAAAS